MEKEKKIEECSVANSWTTWMFSTAGALLAIPVGIKKKSLGPLVFFGTTGSMLDIILAINACEKEFQERQMLQAASANPEDRPATASEGIEN